MGEIVAVLRDSSDTRSTYRDTGYSSRVFVESLTHQPTGFEEFQTMLTQCYPLYPDFHAHTNPPPSIWK